MGFIPAAAHQAVAGHDPAQEKAVGLKRFLAVGRARGTHLAAVPVRGRNEFLVKRNGRNRTKTPHGVVTSSPAPDPVARSAGRAVKNQAEDNQA